MLLTRQEMSYDFHGARFDSARDKDFLSWAFSQFLYGEVTGIQCGHWLYVAPDFESANFIARQAVEELAHVRAFRHIFDLLGSEPAAPNPMVRYLSTGMMEGTWEEHVALEMAQGEGLVLMVFYALIDTMDHPEIKRILEAAVVQEERHVDFGEKQTRKALAARPERRRSLLGLNLVSLWAMRRLASFIGRRAPREHPVLSQFEGFLGAVNGATELRLRRLGLLDGPLSDIPLARQMALAARAMAGRAARRLLRGRQRLLTDTYLSDPTLARQGERERAAE